MAEFIDLICKGDRPLGMETGSKTSTYDIWQAASLLVGLYGEEAAIYASARGKHHHLEGDLTGAATWGLIATEIAGLLQEAPLALTH